MSLWTRLRAFAATPSDDSPLTGAVADKAPVSDVAYSESLVYKLADWPKYNPDEITRTRGYKIYLQMMMDEQVKAVVRFKRDAITGRRWFFEFEEEDEDETKEDPADDADEVPGEDAIQPTSTFGAQDGVGQQADSNVDPSTVPASGQPPLPGQPPKKKVKKGLTPEQKEKIQVFEQAIKQMDGSFIDALNGIMSAMFQGYSMTEKVYRQIQVNEKSWWGIQKLRIKPFYSFHFYTDEYGNTDRVQQRWEQSQTEIDINKFIHFVQNPDMDQHYGQSELREAYRAWFSKDMTIRLMNIHLERHASGFVWLSPKEGTTLRRGSQEFADLQSLIQNMTAKTAWILPAGIDVHFERPADTRSFENAIAIHDKAIAKAMLVPNLLGITEQGQTGSYSQSQTQLDAFLWTLDSEANRLEECLNEQLFRQLGELNFGEPPYPRFRFKPISESVKLNIIKTWGEMMRFGVVKHTDTDEAYVREILEFPEAGTPDPTMLPPKMPISNPTSGNLAPPPEPKPGESPAVAPQQPSAPGTAPVVTPKPSAGVMPSLGDATIAPKKQHKTARSSELEEEEEGDNYAYAYNPDQSRDEHGRWGQGAGSRLDSKGKPDPNGAFATNPIPMASGRDLRNAHSAAYSNVIEAYGSKQQLDASSLSTLQKTVSVDRVNQYIANPQLKADVAGGRTGNDLVAVKFGGKTVIVDGNHRAAAALISNRPLSVRVVNMDQAIKDAAAIRQPGEGEHSAIMRAANNRLGRAKHSAGSGTEQTRKEAFNRAVKRVDFAVIDHRSTILTSNWIAKIHSIIKDGVADVVKFVKDNDIKKNPNLVSDLRFSAATVRKMREAMQKMLKEAWDIGTLHAQKEITKAKGGQFEAASPLSGEAADKFLEARAYTFAGDVADNAKKKITTIVYNGIKGDWTLDEMISRIEDETDSTISPQMATGIRTVTFEAINEARYDFFTSPSLDNYVEAFEYSAIIDGKTTEICQHLDGSTYPADSDFWSTYTPPNHFNCRSLLVPVTADDTWSESDPPNVQPQDGFA